MAEYIEREAVRYKISDTDWYHLTTHGILVIGANGEDSALYKAKDVFNAVETTHAAERGRTMICKQCLHLAECVKRAESDPNHAHKLRTIEFWENAETRCGKFEAKTAHWYINPDGYYPQCSNCNEEPESGELEEICPNCGAVMEGETT